MSERKIVCTSIYKIEFAHASFVFLSLESAIMFILQTISTLKFSIPTSLENADLVFRIRTRIRANL